MEKKPHNPNCPFSETHYCDLLNMGSCDRCTIGGGGDTPEQVMRDLDLYESLLPEGGIARLFLSRECQFCKTAPKGERQGYALLDMAHPEPKRIQRKLFRKGVAPVGTLIPLQFSICKRCRRTLLLIEYLPVLLAAVFGALGLVVLALPAVNDAMLRTAAWLPFAIWVTLIAIAYLAGKAISASKMKRAERRMYADIRKHPVVQEMLDKGWFPLSRDSRVPVIFSKSRRVRGLGTAVLPEEETR